jgi:hypothetical protein
MSRIFDGFLKTNRKVQRRDQLSADPGTRSWQNGSGTKKDSIAVIEVMVERLDPAFWQSLRERLERELSQDESSSGLRKSDRRLQDLHHCLHRLCP